MTTATSTSSLISLSPPKKLDTKTLNKREQDLLAFLDERLVGQPYGKKAALRAYRRLVSYIRAAQDGTQPAYNVLALGPTTCGKTELFYLIVEFVHGNRAACIKFDGSDFLHDYQLSAINGASKNLTGYVNRDAVDYVPPKEGEKDPYAALSMHNLEYSKLGSKVDLVFVLVDEWEKACPQFSQIWLQILRDGTLTLGNGDVTTFKNVVFWFTGNPGSHLVEQAQNREKNPFGFRQGDGKLSDKEADAIITKYVEQNSAPEFRARIEENGEIVIFHALTAEQIADVCEIKVKALCKVVESAAGIQVVVPKAVRDWLMTKSETLAKMAGAVKTYITDVLDNELIKGTVKAGQIITVSVNGDELEFTPLYDEATLALMAEVSGTFKGRPTFAQAFVDQAHLGAVAAAAREESKGGNADASNQVAVPFTQPFQVVVQTKDLASLHQVKATLAARLLKTCELVSETSSYAEPFIANFTVNSTLETMVALKTKMPFLRIVIVGGAF